MARITDILRRHMRSRALLVLAISGILGFRFGMVAFPDWQAAVETAQVLAGVVRYPEATPFFIYHTKLWTLLHQALAVFLWLGVSEVRLSLILSGLLGMISLQALSMFVFALSEDVLLAIGASLLIMVTRASDFGAVYPIYLMGSVHTYGIAGLSLFVLVVSLLGAGCYRLGGFLLALAPSIHPSLGIWLFVVVAICFLWDRRLLSEASAQGLKYFVAGSLVTGVSLIVHLTSAFPAPPLDSETSARYLSAFVALWDPHRYPVAMGVDGVALNRAALALALLWLAAFTSDLPRSAAFLLRVTITAAILSLVLVMVSWIPPDRLPPSLLILMPARLANFNAMTFVALLIGLLGAYRARAWSPVLALLLTIGLMLGPRSELWSWLQQRGTTAGLARWASWFDVWLVLEIVSVALILLVLTTWNNRRAEKAQPDLERPPERPFRVAAASARVALVLVFVSMAVVMWQRAAPRTRLFENYETNPVFREASKGTGLMITGGSLSLIQLRTRRPVLLNGGGLDGLPYSLDAGPETERILRDVYEIDFFNPPEEARRSGVIPSEYNQKVWEQFSLEKWQTIGYIYRVRHVLTFAGWSLSLPVVAQDRALRLYQIPD